MAGHEVIIVGGGVIGSAVACFLQGNAEFDGRVLVVERDPAYGECSTARSVGGIRQQFSTLENIRISQFAVEFVRNAGDYLGVEGEAPDLGFPDLGFPDLGFVEAGYLFLASEAGLGVLRSNNRLQRECGADVVLLDPAGLAARFPWLGVDDLAAGSLGLSGEGWIDPYALLQAFRRKARHQGVRYLEDEVVGFRRRGARLESVRLARAGELACATVVNAAGPYAARIARLAGVDVPVQPRKRQVFVFACREPITDCPLVIDPSGLYFRPEGPSFICGISPAPDQDPDTFDLDIDYGLFEAELWPRLAARVPAFEAIKLTSAWACRYAYNTFDQNALVGPHPELDNFMLANGFSGHGLQQSPAVGRALAELIVHGGFRTLDLGRFGCERVMSGRPIRELNVV